MRAGALLAILLVVFSGCARLQAILGPPAPGAPPAEQPARAVPSAPAVPPALAVPPTAAVPAPPKPRLTPQMSADQERQLLEEAQRKLDETDRLLRQMDGRPLGPNELETLVIAQRFLGEARKAMEVREYQRAANLVGKAQTLGDDLAKAMKIAGSGRRGLIGPSDPRSGEAAP